VATCPAAPSSPGTSRSSRNRGSGWKAAAWDRERRSGAGVREEERRGE
jgi:hypothetical protein